MGKFDGVILCTDLDGTLLRGDGTVSAENIAAIEFFKSEGGIFSFVTGRMPFFVWDIYRTVMPNAPIGCINGGGLYDFSRSEYIWTCSLSDEVLELVKYIDCEVPSVGIQVNTFNTTYFCKDNSAMEFFRKISGLPNITCKYTQVQEPIAKILFACDTEADIHGIENKLREHPLWERFGFVRSGDMWYEILPKGIGKGTAIAKLAQYLCGDISKTVVIGDHNNDVSMLETAKIGIAVANATPAAKKAADYITVSNEEHAVAKVIFDLEHGNIGF